MPRLTFFTASALLLLVSLSTAESALNFSSEFTSALHSVTHMGSVGTRCVSISDCNNGLVCAVGNPLGTCQQPNSIIGLASLVANIIQLDYTVQPGRRGITPEHGGPTRTSRAMAIIFLAAHDAFSLCSTNFRPQIESRFLPALQREAALFRRRVIRMGNRRRAVGNQCQLASLTAGYSAAELLYPRSNRVISSVRIRATSGAINGVLRFGRLVASAWERSRQTDGSNRDQLDNRFSSKFLRHQPDPNFGIVTTKSGSQPNFGRFWGRVRPFILNNVERDAFLKPFPGLNTAEYRANLREVRVVGQCNNRTIGLQRNNIRINDLGTFWGYDGMPGIGVPPRLYLQVVLSVQELYNLPFQRQLRALTAVNAAMADAGISSWFWKFKYDLWRPVLGIRRDRMMPDRDWSPFGVPFSNIRPDTVPMCVGLNPDFPAYPSGHATFGTAAFQTLAKLLGRNPRSIRLRFTSDEFNGVTIDGIKNERRRIITQTLTLQDCITQNLDSRVFNGVHWRFDSEGGNVVGTQIAERAAREFSLPM